ncbi:MAG: secretin N-terminal domain-containing protein [Phycisphaerales bacterium]
MLSDLSTRIDEQLSVLRQLDTPENATVMVPVTVSNVAPTQAAALIMQLATKREAVSGEKLPGEVIAGGTGAGGAGGSAGVLVIAPKRAIERWKQLVALADQRESVTTQTYTPRLFSVKDVAGLIQQIAGEKAASGVTDERFKVVTEEPTGSLIVTATPTQHEKIEALMARLDAVPGESRRPVRSFLVRNRPVNEFVATLQRLITAGVLEGTTDPASSQVAGSGPPPLATNVPLAPGMTTVVPTVQPPPSSPPIPVASRQVAAAGSAKSLAITLTADEPTNTIIAVGDGRLLDQLDALVKTLDVRQAQVMLEAYIVAFSESDKVSLGVELDQLGVTDGTRVRLASLFGLPALAGTLGGAAAEGGNALILSPGDFSVVIQAMQTLKNGRTLSLPQMLVSNNQRASLNAVNQAPYAASFTAGNASTPTTSYGGSSDAGTQVTVRPQIGDGGSLLLDYNISISAFTADPASSNLPPPRSVTSVQSLATIPDGYTVVVGGMQTQSQGSEVSQVPLLGSIPGLGELFKKQSHSTSTQRFIVFIKATVMRDQSLESLRYVSDVDAAAAQLPSSWPRSVPQVVR